ncbi:MAG: flagellar hook basal-body protein [Thermodesulforhabdaceae bacterium]
MSRIMSISLSGMINAAQRMNVISHNVANTQTPGFKAQRVHSADVVTGSGEGAGVSLLALSHSTSPGPIIETGDWSNLALNGSGYFALQDPSGKVHYTRNGSFHLDDQGFLVNDQGYRLMNSQGNPIPSLDPSSYNAFQVDDQGHIWGIRSDGTVQNLGNDYQIGVAKFPNESGLVSEGGTLYMASPQSGPPDMGQPGSDGRGLLISGFIEGSNVRIEEEMVGTILAKTAYEANAKVISTANDMNKALLDIKT